MAIAVPAEIQDLMSRGALVVINHSGGKDSQAMTAELRKVIPASQIVVVHAVLPEVEWEGTEEHARATTEGLPFYAVRAVKTFFQMVEHRGRFPSPEYRQCTSDLKRGPIDKQIRALCKARGVNLVVNCMGLRAEESTSRAKQPAVKFNKRMSVSGRTMLDWLPIHDMTKAQVFASIADAGQSPHWAYAAGMSRLSCCFCIMSNKADLTTAAKLQPALYGRYVATEKRLNFTLSPSRQALEEITGVRPVEAREAA